jgi:hypothetical protein
MPVILSQTINPLIDGRQSERALTVRRGVQRLLLSHGHAMLCEMPLTSGRRADMIALTRKGEFWIIEIKSSIEDFRVDHKWPDYQQHCDRLFFATLPDVPMEIFPEECGFILSDGYDAEIVRHAPHEPLAAASRKALTLRFARFGANRVTLAELAGVTIPDIPEQFE